MRDEQISIQAAMHCSMTFEQPGELTFPVGEMPTPPQPQYAGVSPILGPMFAVIGTISLVIGLAMGFRSWEFASSALRAEGKVIGMIRDKDGNSAPVVRYRIEDKIHEFQGGVYSSPPAFSVGETVTVLYSGDNPGAVEIDSFADQWLSPFIIGCVGLCVAGTGCGLMFARHREKRNRIIHRMFQRQ